MKKVLVANRGEIACRIIRALADLSIQSVAIYSLADKDSLHVKLANESVCIGDCKPADSYLNMARIIAACEITGADAIAPGYGFLSENATFAEIVEKSGIIFIGPHSSLIRSLGDKINAKKLAKLAHCPVIEGGNEALTSLEEGKALAREIGYPVFIKAAAGGGGKGIKVIRSEDEFKEGYLLAKQEALILFNDDSVYLEKMIIEPKHIEVQVAADHFGNIIHLFERDCTLQKRRQKLIEETLSPSLTDEKREEICQAAVRLLKMAGYNSVGTVEFLLDKEGNFYFMEVNTRIQVEHTITEELTGVDLVELQILIAMGKKMPFSQQDIKPLGHVMQFRINAEDPDHGFSPSPGVVAQFILPVGANIRIESHLYTGYRISPYYDSLIAKLIVRGKDRAEVIKKSRRILSEFKISGVFTTIPFFIKMLNEKIFIDNRHHISSIDNLLGQGVLH
jgi:acetyl-CoA carboxylase biotin carboxylase subunit